jgi:hypothetical protein
MSTLRQGAIKRASRASSMRRSLVLGKNNQPQLKSILAKNSKYIKEMNGNEDNRSRTWSKRSIISVDSLDEMLGEMSDIANTPSLIDSRLTSKKIKKSRRTLHESRDTLEMSKAIKRNRRVYFSEYVTVYCSDDDEEKDHRINAHQTTSLSEESSDGLFSTSRLNTNTRKNTLEMMSEMMDQTSTSTNEIDPEKMLKRRGTLERMSQLMDIVSTAEKEDHTLVTKKGKRGTLETMRMMMMNEVSSQPSPAVPPPLPPPLSPPLPLALVKKVSPTVIEPETYNTTSREMKRGTLERMSDMMNFEAFPISPPSQPLSPPPSLPPSLPPTMIPNLSLTPTEPEIYNTTSSMAKRGSLERLSDMMSFVRESDLSVNNFNPNE